MMKGHHMKTLIASSALVLTLALTLPAQAQDTGEHAGDDTAGEVVTLGDLVIEGAFTRATLPNAPVGGGYLTITNNGDEADRLIAAVSAFSPDVQIHEMAVVNDVMQMRQIEEGIQIPAGESVSLAPGGLHLMFMQLETAFVEGETVPVTLTFENSGEIDIELDVRAFGAAGGNAGHDMGGDQADGQKGH
jgi:periplasmic copper chaperone A